MWTSCSSQPVFLTVRGGYFYDNYKDTGCRRRPVSPIRPPRSACRLRFRRTCSGRRTSSTPRVLQITDFDTTKRGFFNVDYTHELSPGGVHSFKGGLGYPACRQRRRSAVSGRIRSTLLESSLAIGTSAVGRGDLRLLRGQRLRDLRRGQRQHVVAVRAGPVERHATACRSIWASAPRTNRCRVSRPDEAGRVQVQLLRQAGAPPRCGYDLTGDGRVKAYGSWGRYFDWTKYELARGSFGGDFWQVYYRSLDTLDVYNLNLSNMPGSDLWGRRHRLRRNRRVNYARTSIRTSSRCTRTASAAAWNTRPLRTPSSSVHYVHNDLRTDDRGHRRHWTPTATKPTSSAIPVKAFAASTHPSGRTPARTADAEGEAAVRRARAGDCQPPVLEQLVLQRQLHVEPPVRQLLGYRELGRNPHADDRRAQSGSRSSRWAMSPARVATPTARGTSTS